MVEAKAVQDHVRSVVRPALLRSAREQALERDVVGDVEQEHDVQGLSDLLEHRIQSLGLGHGPREPVEDEAVLVGEALTDQVDHEVVGNEISAFENRLDLQAELRALGDRRPQDVSGGDMRDVVERRDPPRLRSFSAALRAEDENSHVLSLEATKGEASLAPT